MLKNISRLELSINGRVYQFNCEVDSPIPDCKEAMFQMQKYMGMVEDNFRAQQEQAKKDAEDAKIVPIEAPKEV